MPAAEVSRIHRVCSLAARQSFPSTDQPSRGTRGGLNRLLRISPNSRGLLREPLLGTGAGWHGARVPLTRRAPLSEGCQLLLGACTSSSAPARASEIREGASPPPLGLTGSRCQLPAVPWQPCSTGEAIFPPPRSAPSSSETTRQLALIRPRSSPRANVQQRGWMELRRRLERC